MCIDFSRNVFRNCAGPYGFSSSELESEEESGDPEEDSEGEEGEEEVAGASSEELTAGGVSEAEAAFASVCSASASFSIGVGSTCARMHGTPSKQITGFGFSSRVHNCCHRLSARRVRSTV